MTKAQKRKTVKKRDPKEERLIVREDPTEALARLLKPSKVASLKAEFDAAHKDGMDALERGDSTRLGTPSSAKPLSSSPSPRPSGNAGSSFPTTGI